MQHERLPRHREDINGHDRLPVHDAHCSQLAKDAVYIVRVLNSARASCESMNTRSSTSLLRYHRTRTSFETTLHCGAWLVTAASRCMSSATIDWHKPVNVQSRLGQQLAQLTKKPSKHVPKEGDKWQLRHKAVADGDDGKASTVEAAWDACEPLHAESVLHTLALGPSARQQEHEELARFVSSSAGITVKPVRNVRRLVVQAIATRQSVSHPYLPSTASIPRGKQKFSMLSALNWQCGGYANATVASNTFSCRFQ
jgi:hypothetical protein